LDRVVAVARGYGEALMLDWSAYTRVLLARARGAGDGRLSSEQLDGFEAAVLADELHVCTPFRLEARYSARSRADFRAISAQLDGFRQAPADAETWRLAERAQQRLADAPRLSHRVKLADLLVAAIASQHGLAVLHYDADYDTIAAHRSPPLRSRWIAPRGTID
jgi:predicted nucleic acid-binding protein